MPPPNVTGILHMGHALDVTTQDILIRYQRMRGYETLWVPGMDHAGIATQLVVEKKLAQEQGKSRCDYGREEFLAQVWEWKHHHGGVIEQQQRALGASCDWSYSLFTMDPHASRAVNRAFVEMYREGLIYQSEYIVNWDPKLQTAISDAEVEHREVQGAYYSIKYPLKGREEFLLVATTRPETLFGDTAVAVHPEDERFKQYIGQTAVVPLCGREVPIIGDEYVDRQKGTGCLKVTPGHDFNDFELGKRHGLPVVIIFNQDGTLNQHALEWSGLGALAARAAVVQGLEERGVLVKTQAVLHQVAHGERSGAVIEPMVSRQWFVRMAEMAKQAVQAVDQGGVSFYPKSWENTYFSWLKQPRDWCISRQLWWGHRIPVFSCQSCCHQWAQEDVPQNCPQCQAEEWEQDPDVLDTWFSSALWPFSTLGWPDQQLMREKGFERFYPSSVLITGYDIIFFWVARMVMMGIKHLKQIPFHQVYIHAIVRDKYGRKMSKSLGNGIDPLEICQSYGADALRFSLAADSGYNRTLNLDLARIAGYRNFINKLWNAFRFIQPFLEQAQDLESWLKSSRGSKPAGAGGLSHQDRWILGELSALVKAMNHSLVQYRFDDACSAIYQFTYEKFCSCYIEFSKPILYGEDLEAKTTRASVLKHCLSKMMALLHPIAPFISEEIWHHIKGDGDALLIATSYPEADDETYCFASDQRKMNQFIAVVTVVRSLRQSMNLSPRHKISLELFSDHQEFCLYLRENSRFLCQLARVEHLEIKPGSSKRPANSVMAISAVGEIFIPLGGDSNLQEHLQEQRARLERERAKIGEELGKLQKKLANPGFLAKAPAVVVLETRKKSEGLEEKLGHIAKTLESFAG